MTPRLDNARALGRARVVLLTLVTLALAPAYLLADERSLAAAKESLVGFDSWTNEAIHVWEVPGLAIAVVKNGEVILAEGYGLRDVDKKLPVTPKTLFAIGSCTKAFTT
ncbi:MAG TPA: serine hydrolase domain-containing protein, partial [Isosphaeraceae bacterium]|nr:serine hydrolase domain-containing protein [Isosphaeraceae bacterium]